MTKNADIEKYKYSEYRIGFDRHEFFAHSSGETGRNLIIFGVDVSSSTKIDNRKRKYLHSWYTCQQKKIYSINFTENNKKSV